MRDALSASAKGVHVIIADDEDALTKPLAAFFEASGIRCTTCADGATALRMILAGGFDAAILDQEMPELRGTEVAKRLRAESNWTPLVLLTKHGGPQERTAALWDGVDDYLNKPFSPPELLARVWAVVRRSRSLTRSLPSYPVLSSTSVVVDRVARRAKSNGVAIDLTPKAFSVLEFLMLRPFELVERDRILESVWGFSEAVVTRALDHRVSEIRVAIVECRADASVLQTKKGVGYGFMAAVEGQDHAS